MKKIKLLIAFACIGTLTFYACKKDSDDSTAASCTDGIQNQSETGIDCGGPCAACSTAATCSDGIQNQGETGIDCGGPCPACGVPSCTDGIKNQNETDIDCGGVCPACPPAAMTCLVDGVSWSANNSKTVYVTTNTRLVGIQIAVNNDVGQIAIALQGTIVLNTSYNLLAPPAGITVIEKKYVTTINATGTTTTYNATSGATPCTIKFTRLDTVNGKASGTFSGTFVSTIGGTVTKQITNGVFTNLPIQ
jgi:hypothetical protein